MIEQIIKINASMKEKTIVTGTRPLSHGEFSAMGVPFLHIKYELCSFRAYSVIFSRNWELVDKHVNLFLLQILGQLQFNGHPSFVIAQIPDTFSQNSIHYSSNFV